MDKQNNGFALVVARTYIHHYLSYQSGNGNVNVENKVSSTSYKCFATNWGKLDHDGVIPTTT